MSYLVIARKYRPDTFSSVSSQLQVTQTLKNAIKRDKVGHALLFTGPRGVGKTSVARILAKALNCKSLNDFNPCNECATCKEISSGVSFAVQEIDGASHNGVDNIRDLIDNFRTPPPPGFKFKVYIIDEVHMLSLAAFNALLKSLEEPPPQTVFILATTELHKIPETVLSRCQRYDFKSLSVTEIQEKLKEIAGKESLIVEPSVFRLISRLADGSMRDAQTIFDRVTLYCDEGITEEAVTALLGITGTKALSSLSSLIVSRKVDESLRILSEILKTGVDIGLFLKDFANHFRDLLLIKNDAIELLRKDGLDEESEIELQRTISGTTKEDIQDLESIAREGADRALRSVFPKHALEALIVRMANRIPVEDIGVIIKRISSGTPQSHDDTRKKVLLAAPHTGESTQRIKEEKNPQTFDAPKKLDWRVFVEYVVQSKQRVIAEQLKRVVVRKFENGILELTTSKFTSDYLKRPAESDKLKNLLKDHTHTSEWKIDFVVSEEEEGSLAHEVKIQKKAVKEEKTRDLMAHPNVQAIHSLFPGSEVEYINDGIQEGDDL